MSIELIVLDVDGTMTDGRISYTSCGDEIKSFSVKDGLGIASWIKLGKQVAIITGRSSQIVQKRAQELGITHYYQGIKDKKKVLDELLVDLGLEYANVAAIGDDLNDYAMLKDAHKSFVPADAVSILKNQASTIILRSNGGDGAVREMIDYLIKEEGLEGELYRLWSVE